MIGSTRRAGRNQEAVLNRFCSAAVASSGSLAKSTDQPVPSSEARGLLLLSVTDIESLCSRTLTLATYLDEGRPATFNPKLPEIDTDMTLDPRGPRVLKRLLDIHPEIGNTP